MLFLTNMGERPTPIGCQVQANGARYYLTDLALKPHATRAIDLRKLRGAQKPDLYGGKIPRDATDGSVLWVRADNVPVMGRLLVMERHKGPASNYDCTLCQCPLRLGSTSLTMSPTSATLPIGNNQQYDDIAAMYNCNNNYYPIPQDSYSDWLSTAPSVASVNRGLVAALAAGGSTIQAHYSGCMSWTLVGYSCYCQTPGTAGGSGGASVVGKFGVEYSSYIPVDHVTGPTSCGFQSYSVYLLYMGDANRSTVRTKQFLNTVPDTQTSSGYAPTVGQTRNYGYASPANGSTLSSANEDGVANDCYLWNAAGCSTNPYFTYGVTYPQSHQGQVRYTGSASNPLEVQWVAISWDTYTYISTTVPTSPTASVSVTHTCDPSHQIKVNGQVVYLYTPPWNDTFHIGYCLIGFGQITGTAGPVFVPTH